MDCTKSNHFISHDDSITVNPMFEDELEDTLSSFTTSFIFEDELEMPNESCESNREDEVVDPFIYCYPMYFAFTNGTYV